MLLRPADLSKWNHQLVSEINNRGNLLLFLSFENSPFNNDPSSQADFGSHARTEVFRRTFASSLASGSANRLSSAAAAASPWSVAIPQTCATLSSRARAASGILSIAQSWNRPTLRAVEAAPDLARWCAGDLLQRGRSGSAARTQTRCGRSRRACDLEIRAGYLGQPHVRFTPG